MQKRVSCTAEQLQQFMRLADIYGWEKTWTSLSGYLKTEPLRKKWTQRKNT